MSLQTLRYPLGGDWCLGGKNQDAFEVGLDVASSFQYQLRLTTPKG
jgi:predicted NAD/FAD-dependent oxidoreductase